MNPDIFRTLVYSEPWHNLKWRYIQIPVKYTRWSILFRTLCNCSIYGPDIFKTLAYSELKTSKIPWIFKIQFTQNLVWPWDIHSPSTSILKTQGILRALLNMYHGPFSISFIFRTGGILRTLSNICGGELYFKQCVTLAYLEPWHIQNPRYIQNTAKNLSWNILFKTLWNTDIFRALVYWRLWYILKSKHIQNPTKYLRWSIFSRTLYNYSKFRRLIYPKLSLFQDYSLMYQRFFKATNLLLITVSTILY